MTTIWTHSGNFHADEVFACATIVLKNEIDREPTRIFRSRTSPTHINIDMTIDVGGIYDPNEHKYDHHQKNGPVRENGIRYSGFGLIWKHFGEVIVTKVLNRSRQFFMETLNCQMAMDYAFCQEVARRIDVDFVETIDAVDNGQAGVLGTSREVSMSQIIGSFMPLTMDDSENVDEAFFDAVDFAKQYLCKAIHRTAYRLQSEQELERQVNEAIETDATILVLNEAVPFVEYLMNRIDDTPSLKIIVYPGITDDQPMWFIRTAPGSKINRQCSKCPAPLKWRGLRDKELQHETCVSTAIFIHPSGFLGGTVTKEDALIMARSWAYLS